MVTASMVSSLGVCTLMAECVSGVLLMIRLVTRLPTDRIVVEGLGHGWERREINKATSSTGKEGESIKQFVFWRAPSVGRPCGM